MEALAGIFDDQAQEILHHFLRLEKGGCGHQKGRVRQPLHGQIFALVPGFYLKSGRSKRRLPLQLEAFLDFTCINSRDMFARLQQLSSAYREDQLMISVTIFPKMHCDISRLLAQVNRNKYISARRRCNMHERTGDKLISDLLRNGQ